jgi:hypothetical protein
MPAASSLDASPRKRPRKPTIADSGMKPKLILALAAYLLLALIATFMLDGVLRTALWIFFIGLAAKTLTHSRDDEIDR